MFVKGFGGNGIHSIQIPPDVLEQLLVPFEVLLRCSVDDVIIRAVQGMIIFPASGDHGGGSCRSSSLLLFSLFQFFLVSGPPVGNRAINYEVL